MVFFEIGTSLNCTKFVIRKGSNIMRKIKFNILIVFTSLLILPTILKSQEATVSGKDALGRDSLVWDNSILPVAFYLPETSFAAGATGILSFKKSSQGEEERPSQLLFAAIYTLKNQLEILGTFEFYADERKHRLKGEFGYYIYSYNYFGIGADSRAEDLEKYKVNFPRFQLSYSRKILGLFNLGVGYRMDDFSMGEREENGLLLTNKPIGWDGGFKSNYEFNFFVDTRDNINAPYRGFYGEVVFQGSMEWFFSDYDYRKLDIDLRYFTPLGNDWTLGHQLWVTHSSSGAPFYEVGHISTASRSRGFDDRRFIAYKMATYQSELRFPIAGKKLRGSAFYTYNIMPDSWSSPFASREFFSYGIGLRYYLIEKSRAGIRLDVARGDGKYNFYLTFNEAF